MSDKYIFDEKEVFKPMAKTEFDYEKFYPKLMENYCIALSRIEELEDEVKQLHEEEEKEYNRSEDALVRAETAEDRVKELESRELGYIQSLRELEARVRELEKSDINVCSEPLLKVCSVAGNADSNGLPTSITVERTDNGEVFARYVPDERVWELEQKNDALSERVRELDWISVEDRLPSDDLKQVCVWEADCERVSVCEFPKGWAGMLKHKYITHWMPLPEPPKAD